MRPPPKICSVPVLPKKLCFATDFPILYFAVLFRLQMHIQVQSSSSSSHHHSMCNGFIPRARNLHQFHRLRCTARTRDHPCLVPTIPDTKTNFKSCNTAIQSDASHSTTRCQILCGCRLAYKLLINPAWSMYFSIHTLCSLRRIGGMVNLFYFETVVHAVGKVLDIIVRKCIGECLKNVVAYIFKIWFSEKPRGMCPDNV